MMAGTTSIGVMKLLLEPANFTSSTCQNEGPFPICISRNCLIQVSNLQSHLFFYFNFFFFFSTHKRNVKNFQDALHAFPIELFK